MTDLIWRTQNVKKLIDLYEMEATTYCSSTSAIEVQRYSFLPNANQSIFCNVGYIGSTILNFCIFTLHLKSAI